MPTTTPLSLARRSPSVALLLVLGGCASAPESADGEWRALFDGRSLEGWVAVNTAPSTWTVVDGMLHCSGKPTGELRTARMYQNFELELEWRHLVPGGNAGVFVWADDLTARGVPFHRGIEVQVLDHGYGNTESHTTHGDVFPIHGATMTPRNGRGGSRAFPTELRSKPSPEWNRYFVRCVDGEITLSVNGAVVTSGFDCSPRKGYICLESEGGEVDYRNLRLRELPDTPIDERDIAIADRGYRTLYSGVDLDGWESTGGWQANDWVLAHRPSGAPNEATRGELTTREAFDSCGFVFDVRVPDGETLPSIVVAGSDLDLLSCAEVDYAAHLSNGWKGWNRFEGALANGSLDLTLNGTPVLRAHRVGQGAGPIRIAATGATDLANLFVRELD